MRPKITIPAGTRFGRLVVLGEMAARQGPAVCWACRCDCGLFTVVPTGHLKRGFTRSCGCLRKQLTGDAHRTHGRRRSSEYRIWLGMRGRCRNPKNKAYANYGGRGIKVCSEWDDFATFYRDMGPRPSMQHSIDRIDNDGPYSAVNCRWATRPVQQMNRRTTRWVTHDGRTLTVPEWAAETGISPDILKKRLWRGWAAARALTEPPRERR